MTSKPLLSFKVHFYLISLPPHKIVTGLLVLPDVDVDVHPSHVLNWNLPGLAKHTRAPGFGCSTRSGCSSPGSAVTSAHRGQLGVPEFTPSLLRSICMLVRPDEGRRLREQDRNLYIRIKKDRDQ
jgi:hypothetical protein